MAVPTERNSSQAVLVFRDKQEKNVGANQSLFDVFAPDCPAHGSTSKAARHSRWMTRLTDDAAGCGLCYKRRPAQILLSCAKDLLSPPPLPDAASKSDADYRMATLVPDLGLQRIATIV